MDQVTRAAKTERALPKSAWRAASRPAGIGLGPVSL